MYVSSHPEFAYTLQTNSAGLRDEPLEGLYDVTAIGDSFTFGFGVEHQESWTSRLENISSIQVANLGFAGSNSYVYPVTIKRHAVPLKGRIWIWAFFINDLLESANAQDFIESGQEDYKRIAFPPQPFPRNTQVWNILAPRFNQEYSWLPSSIQHYKIFNNGPFFMQLTDYAWKQSEPDNPDVERGWNLTEAALEEGQRLAAENNALLVLVHIPTREHVYWPVVQEELEDFDVSQLDAVSARLSAIAASYNIPFLDLLPGLRAEAVQGRMLYFSYDGHWNAAGHDLAAKLIDLHLRDEGLIE